MAIENFNEVQEYLTANAENEEVSNYLQGINKISLDGVKTYLETDGEGKSYFDTRVSKAIETYKTNTLPKLVEAEVLKKNPKLTPEQLEIQNVKQELETIKKEKVRAEQMVKYKDVLSEKKIPSKMVDFLLANDEEATNANISLFEESMKSYIEEAIKAKFGDNVHIPASGTTTPPTLISQAEWDKNKDDLSWYEKNKKQIYESMKQGLIK